MISYPKYLLFFTDEREGKGKGSIFRKDVVECDADR